MIRVICAFAIVVGVLLRIASASWHDHPRGDVVLDVGVARSLSDGEGYRSGFERGTALVRGEGPVPPQHWADQHPPLWPLIGARLSWVAGSAFAGLKLASLVLGLLLLALVWTEAQRIATRLGRSDGELPAVATGLTALSFPLIDASGNGSLYIGLACAAVLMCRLLGRRRPSPLFVGLVLGAAWLLTHQAIVLLPVPAIVLCLTAERKRRLRGLEMGLLAAAVAALLQGPWWWRNAELFDDPFYSVNLFYPLYKAGVEPVLAVVMGLPEARFPDPGGIGWFLGAQRTWLPPNALYLLSTGLLLWPGLIAIVAAGALPLLRRAVAEADRRVLALLFTTAALAAVALVWPGMKLRYLVPLTPLVILLGTAVLGSEPSPGERRFGWLVAAGWLGVVLITAGDVVGAESDDRPLRWNLVGLGGLVLFVLPLLLRHRALTGAGLRTGLMSGLLIVPLVTAFAFAPAPHTAYHSTVLTPDAFGRQKEAEAAREATVLETARIAALALGARRMAGPVELLAWPTPDLITLPEGAGTQAGDEALAALVDAERIDHVLVLSGRGWPEGLVLGDLWLGERLEVVAVWSPDEENPDVAGATLFAVRATR